MAWYKRSKLGLDMLRNLSKYTIITGAAVATASAAAYLSSLETVPYSGRRHVVLMPRQFEKAWTNVLTKDIIKEEEGKLLPATHPTIVRVGLINQNLIDALRRDLIRQGYDRKYLEHVSNNWRVLVVDDPSGDFSTCYSSGKIILSSSRVKNCESDADIASVIAPLVAAAVARHGSEIATKCARFFLFDIFVSRCLGRSRSYNMSSLCMCPLSGKLDLEADYMGLLLMASAGYDPRVAAASLLRNSAAQDLDLAADNSYWAGFFKNFPSPEKRVQSLSQAQEEAMQFYLRGKSHD